MIKSKGKIIKWDDDRGFGFILPDDSNKHIFVHIKSFKNQNPRPSLNEQVTYNILQNNDGKQSAVSVIRATDNLKKFQQNNIKEKNLSLRSISNKNNSGFKVDYKSTYKISIFYILFVLIFLAFLLYSFISGKLPLTIIIVYGIMSLITYLIYSEDKSKAITEDFRIQEKTLHILSLIGGWMGAIIAQQRFRHKTKKSSFQRVFWISVFFNVLILIYNFKLL